MIRTVVCCLALFSISLQAQSTLSLADAVREARERHPQLQAAIQRVAAAEGLRRQAGLGLNPRLFLQSENTRLWGNPSLHYPTDTDNFGYLSQIYESGGKRERRVELAASNVRLNEFDRAVLERQIAGRVSLAYWTAAAAASLRDLLNENVASFERVVQYHRDRVREGAMAEVDLLRILLERDRLAVAGAAAQADYEQALIALQREMGRTVFEPIALSDRLNEPREIPRPDFASILSARPEMQAARENVERARANLRLQNALAKPDPEVLFGYKRTGGYDTLLGGFQINLPFRNRNQGQIASASAEVRVAENQVRAIEAQLRAEAESAWAAYEARRKLLTGTLQPMQDRAAEIARIAQAAYREGGIDLLRLIDAERARIEAMSTYYRALSEYQQSVTMLQIVTGAPL